MGVKIQIVYSRPDSADGPVNVLLMETLRSIHEADIKYKLNVETSQEIMFDLIIDDILIYSAQEAGELPGVELIMEQIMEYSKNHN